MHGIVPLCLRSESEVFKRGGSEALAHVLADVLWYRETPVPWMLTVNL